MSDLIVCLGFFFPHAFKYFHYFQLHVKTWHIFDAASDFWTSLHWHTGCEAAVTNVSLLKHRLLLWTICFKYEQLKNSILMFSYFACPWCTWSTAEILQYIKSENNITVKFFLWFIKNAEDNKWLNHSAAFDLLADKSIHQLFPKHKVFTRKAFRESLFIICIYRLLLMRHIQPVDSLRSICYKQALLGIHACAHTCMHGHTHACTHTRMHTRMHAHTPPHVPW